ncbi:MAG: LLM class flavin-dependent oxidoreductase, partial [Chloroflexota bacterium]|nr:LLM class flavin-dependent oxidoreductase [Chloroflexota bacterium]
MRYGIYIPNLSAAADPRLLIELSQETEQAGWDGFFLWDHISVGLYALPCVDPWIVLAAIATSTKRIRLGQLVTPLPRRRPWK